jgi:hypothetical protein
MLQWAVFQTSVGISAAIFRVELSTERDSVEVVWAGGSANSWVREEKLLPSLRQQYVNTEL